jgi:hypothetical protein
MFALFEFLQDKLEFIGRLYDTAAGPFETDLKKIEDHEEPYDTLGDEEDDEPAFLNQWIDDTDSLNLLGKACLCLVQSAFRSYLDWFIIRSGRKELLADDRTVNVSKATKGKNWFEKYQAAFLEYFGIDWQASPLLALVEDVNLARNRIEHGGTFYDLSHKQDPLYFSRFPDSVFADEQAVFSDEEAKEPYRIRVTRENLVNAIEGIKSFCEYLEGEWQKQGH